MNSIRVSGAPNTCPKCGTVADPVDWRCAKCLEVLPTGTIRTSPKVPTRISAIVPSGGSVRSVRPPFRVGLVTFSDCGQLSMPLIAAGQAAAPCLSPGGHTNLADGLRVAGEALEASGACEKFIVVATDGDANRGGGLFGSDDPKQSAINGALGLRSKGVRMASIAIRGGAGNTLDLDTVRQLASSPSLYEESWSGQIRNSFVRVTKTATATSGRTFDGTRALVLVVDSSGSMDEGTKKQETDQAVQAVVDICKSL